MNLMIIFGFLLLMLISIVIFIYTGRTAKKADQQMPIMTKEKEEHYRENGMTSDDIVFFRQTMATCKEQIMALEKNMRQGAKLKSINLHHDTLKAAKGIFKELVKEPRKLHQANQFLYTHLPNLLELTNKYLEISRHDVKTKDTFAALEKSAIVIEEMAAQITDDYSRMMADDFEELDIEIKVAKQSLSRDKEDKSS